MGNHSKNPRNRATGLLCGKEPLFEVIPMRAFTFRGARVRVTTHNLIVARDLTHLLFGRQNLNLLGGLPGGTVVSVPRESLTGDTSGLKPSVRLLSRDGAVHLMNSARYPHADEFLVELDKVISPDLRSRIQSANTIEDLRSVLLELYLEIQGP